MADLPLIPQVSPGGSEFVNVAIQNVWMPAGNSSTALTFTTNGLSGDII